MVEERVGLDMASTCEDALSSSVFVSARIQTLSQQRSEFSSEDEFLLHSAKDHWSEWQPEYDRGEQTTEEDEETSEDTEEEAGAVAEKNLEIFKSLRDDPEWGRGFFGGMGEFVRLGKKIGEGAQAEIYEIVDSDSFVAKVFKKDVSLQALREQWPKGMLRNMFYKGSDTSIVCCGFMTQDGRFSFMMARLAGDLRSLMDSEMLKNNKCPPFTYQQAKLLMWHIANGVQSLHKDGILHRDLKASNVLYEKGASDFLKCYVADFECSVGIIGTAFWRAPEILLALKNRKLSFYTFTKEADVYSYAMTSYEILTGCVPFDGTPCSPSNYHIVLDGQRPELPSYVEPELRSLLESCWHEDPSRRPSFTYIKEKLREFVPFTDHNRVIDGIIHHRGNFFFQLMEDFPTGSDSKGD